MQESFHITSQEHVSDKIEVALRSLAQNILVIIFGLLPIFFIPIIFAPFGYSKVLLVIVGVSLSLIFFSLSVLRSGFIRIQTSLSLLAFWGIAIVTAISALLSGDMLDSFIGSDMGVQTGIFMLLLALIISLPSVMGQAKPVVLRLYILLTGTAIILSLFHLLRIIFGTDFLSLGIFSTLTSTPMGAWNDLGLFFGLTILLSLVALEQLPLTKWGKILFSVVVAISLLMLAVVNFFAIWMLLALVSLIQLMYSLTKDRYSEKTLPLQNAESASTSVYSVALATMVFVVSLLFIIGGSAVGGFVSNITGISYVEVRPSLTATIDIGREVYKENMFVGVGPNKFVDAWRLYKDPSINQTIFWATDFTNGSGFITTQFVTGGIFTVIAWILFFVLFIIEGFRMLFRTKQNDTFWYFIGTSSFVASCYLWSMAIIYNPGPVIILLTAIFTGITLTAYGKLISTHSKQFSVSNNKRTGFILVGVVMLIIVASVTVLFYSVQYYASVSNFNRAVSGVSTTTSLEDIENSIANSYQVFPNDLYARQLAGYQIIKMDALLNIQDPTPEQKQAFQKAATNGVNAAQLAVDSDSTDPQNWSTLGLVYSVLAGAGVDGAKDRALEAFTTARSFDPVNPVYALFEAQLLSRTGDVQGARTAVLSSIQLKPNYTDALFFLTQLDIADGNIDDAITNTRAIISLEPNNPARYYQLGILESSAENTDAAIDAFTRAIALDTNYANARYFLALAYIQKGDTDAAIEQLEIVLQLNPDNTDIQNLLSQLKSGESFEVTPEVTSEQIDEPQTVSVKGEDVTTSVSPDTPLVSAINGDVISDDSAEEVTEENPTQDIIN